MELELNVTERILLLPLLPMEGNVFDLRLANDLRAKVSLNEAEMDKIKLREVEGEDGKKNYMWDGEAAIKLTKKVKFGDRTKKMIQKQISNLNSQDKMSIALLTILEKFDLLPDELKEVKED